MAAISCAVARSKRACASRVSVIVAVPTSKLRFADASCSAIAVLLARVVCERVLCAEDVEVGLAETQDQVLLGGVEIGERRLERSLGLRDGRAVGTVEERLAAVQRRRRARCCRSSSPTVGLRLHAARVGRQRRARPHQRARLLDAVDRRIGERARREVGRVVAVRCFVQLEQRLRVQRRRREREEEPATSADAALRRRRRCRRRERRRVRISTGMRFPVCDVLRRAGDADAAAQARGRGAPRGYRRAGPRPDAADATACAPKAIATTDRCDGLRAGMRPAERLRT